MHAFPVMQKTVSEESGFSYDELFYSKTDERGIIQSGNQVFQRVSEYPWEELIGRPHNVVRHQDMPRGVFFLLWDFLKSGKPIGAFVKNRSKNGKYYWVFALAMPVQGGHLSVRLKPGGPLFQVVQTEYAALLDVESRQKKSPEESATLLLNRLQQLGFPNYQKFMVAALMEQIRFRNEQLARPIPRAIDGMARLLAGAADISQTTGSVLSSYQKSRFIPLNMEAQAQRIGSTGDIISVVAHEYQNMIGDINQATSSMGANSETVIEKIERSQFLVVAAQLMKDVLAEIAKESGSVDRNHEIARLTRSYLDDSLHSIHEIKREIGNFAAACDRLNSLSTGLELIRITGKIEIARENSGSDVTSLLEELGAFQTSVSESMRRVRTGSDSIRQICDEIQIALRRDFSKKGTEPLPI